MSEIINETVQTDVVRDEPQQTETKEVSAPQPNPKADLLSSKFAQLTKKEREISQREKEIKAHHEQLEQYKSLKTSAKEKVNEALEHLGLTAEDVINWQIKQLEADDEDHTPEGRYKKLEAKLMGFEQAQAEKERLEKERLEQAEKERTEQLITNFKSNITSFITDNAEKFELVSNLGATEDVFDVIELNYQKTGKMMNIEQAVELVENHYLEESKAIINKTNKLKSLLTNNEAQKGQTKESVSEESFVNRGQERNKPTLTQDYVSSGGAAEVVRPLSREESLERASKLLKWN